MAPTTHLPPRSSIRQVLDGAPALSLAVKSKLRAAFGGSASRLRAANEEELSLVLEEALLEEAATQDRERGARRWSWASGRAESEVAAMKSTDACVNEGSLKIRSQTLASSLASHLRCKPPPPPWFNLTESLEGYDSAAAAAAASGGRRAGAAVTEEASEFTAARWWRQRRRRRRAWLERNQDAPRTLMDALGAALSNVPVMATGEVPPVMTSSGHGPRLVVPPIEHDPALTSRAPARPQTEPSSKHALAQLEAALLAWGLHLPADSTVQYLPSNTRARGLSDHERRGVSLHTRGQRDESRLHQLPPLHLDEVSTPEHVRHGPLLPSTGLAFHLEVNKRGFVPCRYCFGSHLLGHCSRIYGFRDCYCWGRTAAACLLREIFVPCIVLPRVPARHAPCSTMFFQAPYPPSGDQPAAIAGLVSALRAGAPRLQLKGATGTGECTWP